MLYSSSSSSSGSTDSKLQCPECGDELCGRCKTLWHTGLSCETAQKWAAADGGGSTDAAALKALATQVSVVLLVMAFLTNSACRTYSSITTATTLASN
jgi:IBR domain, a half RING-finger domain